MLKNLNLENYFTHDSAMGVIGRGITLEDSFSKAAYHMFSLMADISCIHPIHIVNIEFEEEKIEKALVTWLNLLLVRSSELQLVFGDFRLIHEGKYWRGTISGEHWRDGIKQDVKIKEATNQLLSVKKIDHGWEVRCSLNQVK